MAKIRFTKNNENRNKKRFKRNLRLKKYANRLLLLGLIVYIAHKENLINIIKQVLQ